MEETRGTIWPSCGDPAHELLDFYLNGSLADDEHERVRSHLETCAVCAAEIDAIAGLAAAVDRHGTRRRRLAVGGAGLRLALAAAAVVAVAVALFWFQGRGRGSGPAPSMTRAEIDLDLSAGVLRDTDDPPAVTLGPDARSVRASLFPPLDAGARPRAVVLDAAGRPVMPEVVLPPLDAAGRAEIVIPASSLSRAGRYEVVLLAEARADVPDARVAVYPFDVRRPDGGP